MRTLLGLSETAAAGQVETIRSALEAIDASLADEAPLVASVLGVPLAPEELPALPPEVQRRRLHQACLQVVLHQATTTPVCLVMEDGHWLDPSSQELLDLVVASLARRPMLVVCTARPGFRHAWTDYTYFHQVAVDALDEQDLAALLRDVLRPYAASRALQTLIHARSGGNPLFVEELVRMLQIEGGLRVQARLDALPAETKQELPTSPQRLA